VIEPETVNDVPDSSVSWSVSLWSVPSFAMTTSTYWIRCISAGFAERVISALTDISDPASALSGTVSQSTSTLYSWTMSGYSDS
jgi:hypothetical protein